MSRTVLTACLPWLLILLASFCVLLLLARMSRARWDLRRLLRLHTDQVGTVQSLSFVLTLPLFVMVMMLIVQVSQLMIGQIVVEYAAVAAARAAVVWIPHFLLNKSGTVESWNNVWGYTVDNAAGNQAPSMFGPCDGGMTYLLLHRGEKYQKIRMAAALACTPISPSRAFSSIAADPALASTLNVLETVYTAMAPSTITNARTHERLQNKLSYAMSEDNLNVEVRVYHSNQEPALIQWGVPSATWEYAQWYEIGWQDPITVSVYYRLAMLPGPGRLLARQQVPGIGGSLGNPTNVYTDSYYYPLYASATMCNEGEKPNYAHFNNLGGQE